ncbi:MAG: hypothetical protein B7Y80_17540 [Hyphomicrobium sp. 32-62-53]|nr:MAG: hypothetical protein B7Z29_17265 [Hyphomicrobium sp. 12-62-95]OYX97953.1 MAG: hypothetical protein B7Y80_17540 [Hyphomicrobium sp. 32-62-53]
MNVKMPPTAPILQFCAKLGVDVLRTNRTEPTNTAAELAVGISLIIARSCRLGVVYDQQTSHY